jgi:branched-chain amino acid transport system permease protein
MTAARLGAALALLFLLALPLFAGSAAVQWVMPAGLSGSALLHVFILIFFFAYLSQCWNILGGFAGQLSLGHAAFFGLGAYTSSLLYVDHGVSPWLGMLAGIVVAGLVGLVVGVVSFHYGLKGPFFTLVTIAFAEILRLLLLHVDWTGGPMGILIPLSGDSLWEFQFRAKEPYYYIALAMMLLSIALVWAIGRSRMGFYFRAIRQDEDAAEAIGVDTWTYKLIAVTVSAGLTGAGGTFYAQYTQYVVPDDIVVVTLSVQILLATIIGGSGTVMGPIIGAFLLIPIGEATRVVFEGGGTGVSLVSLLGSDQPAGEKLGQYLSYLAQGGGGGLAIVLYGAVLMAVVLGMPGGLLPWARRRLARRSAS